MYKHIVIFLLLLSSCSRLLDWGKDPEDESDPQPSFSIVAEALPGKLIKITVPGSEGSNGEKKPSCNFEYEEYKDYNGETKKRLKSIEQVGYNYSWGYYLYQGISDDPYDHYRLTAFFARSNTSLGSPPSVFNDFYSQIEGNSIVGPYADPGDKSITVPCDTSGKTYFYRVSKVNKYWDCSSECSCSTDSGVCCNCGCSGGGWNQVEPNNVSSFAAVTCQK